MFFPEQLAQIRVDGEEIVVGAGDDRQFLETAVGDGALDAERTVAGIVRPLLGVVRYLPQQLQVLDRVLRDRGLVLLPAGALIVTAVRDPLGAAQRQDREARQE